MKNTLSICDRVRAVILLAIAMAAAVLMPHTVKAEAGVTPDETTGAFQVPAFSLPESSLLDAETRDALRQAREDQKKSQSPCPAKEGADLARIPEIRLCEAQWFYTQPLYKKLRERYPVTLAPLNIGGVYTEIFTPSEGVARRNGSRVLINLHGGGFVSGARTGSHLESVPIASLGKIKVISVDYRLAPEYEFPSASEDVEAVYRELLKTYKPQNIGIYGCSAGALLTAQVVAWLQWKGLPTPGAVGMFCGAAFWWADGDSGHLQAARLPTAEKFINAQANPYLKKADIHDPLAYPGRSEMTLARFPPSLLITSTRDLALSSVVSTHSRLVAHGVEARLHVWEGLEHAFLDDPNLPESREAYEIIVKFFDAHLGKPPNRSVRVPAERKLEEALQAQVKEFVRIDRLSAPSSCPIKWLTLKGAGCACKTDVCGSRPFR